MRRFNSAALKLTCEQLSTGCDQMKKLLVGLAAAPESFDADVHAIRKIGKSLRGGFAALGLAKSAAREIQAISRLLAESRNAAIGLETWTRLDWHADPQIACAIQSLIEQQRMRRQPPPPEAIDWCLARIDAALECLHQTTISGEVSSKGLHKLERNLRKYCRKLSRQREDDFHEARKAVKAWLGAATMLAKGTVRHTRLLHRLAEQLGEENDLATLALWLQQHGFTPELAPALWKRIDAARSKIQRQALANAARFENCDLIS